MMKAASTYETSVNGTISQNIVAFELATVSSVNISASDAIL